MFFTEVLASSSPKEALKHVKAAQEIAIQLQSSPGENIANSNKLFLSYQLNQKAGELLHRLVVCLIWHKHLQHVVNPIQGQTSLKGCEHTHDILLIYCHILHMMFAMFKRSVILSGRKLPE